MGEELPAGATGSCGDKQYEMLCKFAFDDYKMLVVDIKRQQFEYIRQYLWASLTVAGVQLSILANVNILKSVIGLDQTPFFKIAIVFSLALSIFVFFRCMMLLLSNGDMPTPVKSYAEAAIFFSDGEQQLRDKYLELLKVFDAAREKFSGNVHDLGLQLRRIAWMMIISICMTLGAFFVTLCWRY